jgi:hypothetical protein
LASLPSPQSQLTDWQLKLFSISSNSHRDH